MPQIPHTECCCGKALSCCPLRRYHLKQCQAFTIHLTLCERHHAWEQRCIMAKSPYCPHPAHTKADAWCKAAFWRADRATRPAAEGVFSSGFVSGFPSQSCPAETGSGGWRNLLYFSIAGTLPASLPPSLPQSFSSSPFLLPISLLLRWNLSFLPRGLKRETFRPDYDWYVHGHTSKSFTGG